MAMVRVLDGEIDFDDPTLVEGLPGVGLVGKIATDHVIETLDMEYYASVDCEGIPRIGVYFEGSDDVFPPIRIYADRERELLALRSDIPVSRGSEFATCMTGWLESNGVTPILLSGQPAEKSEAAPAMFGVATGEGRRVLDEHGVNRPSEAGAIGGPTGALLSHIAEVDIDGVALVVESDPQFPDPEAARVLIERGIGPITGIEVEVDTLVEQAETIRTQREQLARRMGEATEDESTQARPLGMFQ